MRLIDKAKVLKYLTPRIKTETPYGEGYNKALEDAAELVALMPTIEPEVRRGQWIMLEPYGAHHTRRRKCSECGEIKAQELTNFCPNCGARMDGGADNGNKV